MNILDKPAAFDGNTINLPLYHRGHLSLFPGAKVWLCLIPRANEGEVSELVISPIHHDSWSDLWRISLTLRERAGLVHNVFQILADNSINIITAESTTREGMGEHSIEIIANAELYNSPFNDLSHEERSTGGIEELLDLRTDILARMIDDIELQPNGQPRIQIRRVRSLFNARQHYNKALDGYFLKANPKPVVRETTVNKIGRNKVVLSLPKEIQDSLGKAFPAGQVNHNRCGGHYLIVSNTNERFLHVYFLKEADCIIAPTIEHLDEIGAVGKISAAIHEAGFNILTTLSRLYRWGTQAHTEFVLQPPQKRGRPLSINALKRELEAALSTPELVHKYGIKIGYPTNYVTPVQTKRLRAQGGPAAAPWEGAERRSVELVINSKLREYSRRTSAPDASASDSLRFQLLQNLEASRSVIATRSNSKKRGTLFVSYSFNDPKLLARVTRHAQRQHYEVVTAKKILGARTTRDGIISVMLRCTHFLGIWTQKGGVKMRKGRGGYYPSPWLHWEWGVADAMGLTWHLLISSSINEQAWQRIAGETPHSIFTAADFDETLKGALKALPY